MDETTESLRGIARSRAITRVMRMDFTVITGNSAPADAVAFLVPLVFCGFMSDSQNRGGAVPSTAMAAFWTVLYWTLLTCSFFAYTGGGQAERRMTAVMPVSRLAQVRGRYLSAMALLLFGLLELGVEIAIGMTVFHMGPQGLIVVPYAAASAVLAVSVVIPICFSCDFAVVFQRLMWGGAVLFFAAVLVLMALPEHVVGRLFRIDPSLSPGAWSMVAVAAAAVLYASYRVSVGIWRSRELA